MRRGALSSTVPTSGAGSVVVLAVEGKPDPGSDRIVDTGVQTVSPEYFRVMQVSLKAGSFLDGRDHFDNDQVAIVNEALVTKYFSREDPIGRHFRPFDGPDSKGPWLRIVGVVGNEKRTAVANEMSWTDAPVLYRPGAQDPQLSAVLLFRERLTGSPVMA